MPQIFATEPNKCCCIFCQVSQTLQRNPLITLLLFSLPSFSLLNLYFSQRTDDDLNFNRAPKNTCVVSLIYEIARMDTKLKECTRVDGIENTKYCIHLDVKVDKARSMK